jgi:hypothetical protein
LELAPAIFEQALLLIIDRINSSLSAINIAINHVFQKGYAEARPQ